MSKYARNITEAYDMAHENDNTHNSIREATVDAPSKHPIASMSKVLGINPPAGVPVEGDEEPWVVPEDAIFSSEEYMWGQPFYLYSSDRTQSLIVSQIAAFQSALQSCDVGLYSMTFDEITPPTVSCNMDGTLYTMSSVEDFLCISENSFNVIGSDITLTLNVDSDAETGDSVIYGWLMSTDVDEHIYKVWIKLENFDSSNYSLTENENQPPGPGDEI